MLSREGKTYLFSCHSLAGALHYYDNFLADITIQHWHRQYEEVMSWLMEEIVFPAKIENLPSDEHLRLQDIGETIGNKSYSIFENHVLSVAKRDEYVTYCLWILGTLDKFGDLIQSEYMANTEYRTHFLEGENLLKQLRSSIVRSYIAHQKNLPSDTQQSLSNSVKLLASNWLSKLMEYIDTNNKD